MVKVGMIGCGKIAQRAHLPAFAKCKNAEITALCDVNRRTLKQMGARYTVGHLYTDYNKLLARAGVDAVSIALPNYLHAPVAVASAKAKKYILVEKPMATSMKEAYQIVEAARRNRVILMIEQPRRFSPAFQVARKILASGMLGSLSVVRAARWK